MPVEESCVELKMRNWTMLDNYKKWLIVLVALIVAVGFSGGFDAVYAQRQNPMKPQSKRVTPEGEQKGAESAVPEPKTYDFDSPEAKTIIAKGDGVVVTQADAFRLEQFYAKHNFYSTPEQHRNVAVQMRLFALEAKKMGLLDKKEKSSEGENKKENEAKTDNPVTELVNHSHTYTLNLLKDYPVSELAIKSYYYSNPGKFEGTEETGPVPFNQQARNMIRLTILDAKKVDIIQEEYDRLRKKYNVKFCDGGNCQ